MSEQNPFILDDTAYETQLTKKFQNRKAFLPADPRRLHAAIPGVIFSVDAEAGQKVKQGQSLMVIEAMKMRNDILAPQDGVIMTVRVTKGMMVTKGQVLVELE
jgi:biotin carboxyl carrier protein